MPSSTWSLIDDIIAAAHIVAPLHALLYKRVHHAFTRLATLGVVSNGAT